MNTQKYKLHNADLLKENDRSLYKRKKEDEICYDSTSKSKIDFSKTHMNYNLCPHETYTKEELIKIHETTRGKRFPKNGVLFGSTVITLPRDYDGDTRAFFETAYKGLKQMYGLTDEDIVSAFVHMDETSPHLHFNFIPRFEQTISWEKMFPRTMYESQHSRLESWMNSQGIGEVHLLNGETLGFDVQSLTSEQKTVSMEIYALKTERDDIYEKMFNCEHRKEKLQRDIDYHFSQGDVAQIERCTQEWERCNAVLSQLAVRKKEIAKQLEEKFVELNNQQKPTSNQRQLFELIADKSYLEGLCMEKALEFNELKNKFLNFKLEKQRELFELLENFREAFEEAKTEIEHQQIFSCYQDRLDSAMKEFDDWERD